MPSSSFLGQRRSGSVPGSQLLLWSFISGWQFKFIWVWLEFLLRGTGWRMEYIFQRMDYHQQPTLARLAFRMSVASSILLHTIPQLTLLNAGHVGIIRWIYCCSSCSFSSSSTKYLAAMLLLMKPWFYSQGGLFTLQWCQTGELVKDISFLHAREGICLGVPPVIECSWRWSCWCRIASVTAYRY